MKRFLSEIRRIARRLVRKMLFIPGLAGFRSAFSRLPTSRFAHLLPLLFSGIDMIEWRGIRIAVDPAEMQGFYLFFIREYSTLELDSIIEACGQDSCFVDVGANIGMVSLAVAHALHDVTIMAFEPDPKLADRFRSNLNLNPHLVSRIHLFECALGATDGYAMFAPSDHSKNTGTGHVSQAMVDSKSLRVEIRRVDTVFQDSALPRSTVVKIDGEGGELDVRRGGTDTLRHAATVFLETHAFATDLPYETFNKHIILRLADLGFTAHRLSSGGELPIANPKSMGARSHVLAKRHDPD